MGAHTTRRRSNGRAFAIAGRGALTASAAFALIGGGAGVAFAGDAPDSSSSDEGHDSWGHDDHSDKGHDGWGHDKGYKHDRCDDHGKKWDDDKEYGHKDGGLLGGILDMDHEKKWGHDEDCYGDHDGKKWDGEKEKGGEYKDKEHKLPEVPPKM